MLGCLRNEESEGTVGLYSWTAECDGRTQSTELVLEYSSTSIVPVRYYYVLVVTTSYLQSRTTVLYISCSL